MQTNGSYTHSTSTPGAVDRAPAGPDQDQNAPSREHNRDSKHNEDEHDITSDPIYFATVGFFALLTTALPVSLGQPRFLIFAQALVLLIFMGVALQRGNLRSALTVVLIWGVVQLLVITALTWFLGNRSQLAIIDGFNRGSSYLEWAYAGTPFPRQLAATPLTRLAEVAGVLIGTLLTAGIVGAWIFVRTIDQIGFQAGVLFYSSKTIFALPIALPIWSLLRIVAYGGFFVLLSEFIIRAKYSPLFYLTQRRTLLLVSAGALILSLAFELLLPGLWQRLFRPLLGA